MALHVRLFLAAALGLSRPAPAQTQADLFGGSVLHEVRITTPPSDWQGIKTHYLDGSDFSGPAPSSGGFVSAGSHTLPTASGAAAGLYGANLWNKGTTSIHVNGFIAPLFFTSGGQVDMQIAWEATGTGTIEAIAMPANPATANETLVIYVTGFEPVTGPMVKSAASPLQSTTQTPTVNIGGALGNVSFSGLTPGYLGLYQVNVQVPANAPADTSRTVSLGGQSSPGMSLQILSEL